MRAGFSLHVAQYKPVAHQHKEKGRGNPRPFRYSVDFKSKD